MTRTFRVFGVAAVAAVALLGCTPTAAGTQVDVVVPDDALAQHEYGPWAFVVDGELHVGIAGSSTCPPAPVRLEGGSPVLAVTIGSPTGRDACTDDLVPAIFRLDVESTPERVEFIHDDSRTTVEVVVVLVD